MPFPEATNNHDAIASDGQPANAATMNKPDAQLDAAMGNVATLTTVATTLTGAINEHDGELGNIASLTIGNNNVATAINALDVAVDAVTAEAAALDVRIDNIVGYAGTSTVEVVDARTAGNVGSAAATLSDRLEWLEGAQNVYAAAYGFDDAATAAANLTALNAATAAAAALAPSVVHLPAGRFSLNNATIPAGVVVRGARMPYHDRVGGNLEGGTVINGATLSLSDGSGLMDLGIQVTAKNAITGGGGDDCILINVATLGNSTNHGAVWSTGGRNFVHNFYAAYFTHGLILKGSHNRVSMLNTWHCGTIVGLYGDGGQDCSYNQISGVKADGMAVGNAGAIFLKAFGGNHVNSNTISGINIHNGSFGAVLQFSETGSYDCKYNVIGPGVIDTVTSTGVSIEETADATAGNLNGCDYNVFTGLVVKDAGSYSFANNWADNAVGNIITGCISYSPGSGHAVGPFAQYGINQQSGLIAKLTKTAQLVGTGDTTWVDLAWTAEGGPFSIWNPDADNTAELGNVPFANAFYRIFAYIQFQANATGNRYVQLVRDAGGGYSATPFAVTVRPALMAGSSQGVSLEYMATLAAGYRFKIQVKQDSGGNLNVEDNSYVLVQALK